MKKVCTRCGSQLNIAEKQCSSCGAFNPFYISSFKTQKPVNAGINVVDEKLLVTGTREPEEEEGQGIERIGQVHTVHEAAEKGLKQEILRVKDETELYKKQTIEMVQEVRQELHQIDEENKRLKLEVEILSQSRIQQQPQPVEAPIPSSTRKTGKRILIAASVFVMGLGLAFAYLLLINNGHKEVEVVAAPVKKIPEKPAQIPVTENIPPEPAPAENKDTVPVKAKMLIAAATAHISAISVPTRSVPSQPKHEEEPKVASPIITEDKVKVDILGSKLSGCDITVYNTNEIAHIGNLVLIEKEPSGETKYKFSMRIIKGGKTYYTTPYVYYDANGAFVRIDGTNCE